MSEEVEIIKSQYSDTRLDQVIVILDRIAREQNTMRRLMSKFVNAMVEAESEVPEWYRRFCNTMHDLHDIKYMYEDVGVQVPEHILRECERLDDRHRQNLKKLNEEGGTYNKIRREMAADPENRWDHTRLLAKPNGGEDETRHGEQRREGEPGS
jgi:hypothetical protein